jgi:tol-pal system protein YbgF
MMRRLPIALLITALGSSPAWALFDDKEARRQIVDLKTSAEARFDQQARAQLDLAAQIQRQSDEIARLRGQIETLNHELEQSHKRQQDFYLDLDSRLRKFESAPSATPATERTEGSPVAMDPAQITQSYDAALESFKAAKYKEAATAFAGFVERHPEHALAANAQYWLGISWYAQRNCTKAIEAQSLVTTRYPSSDKAPDAWLAIATCQQELGNANGARRTMEILLEKYPASPAAGKARERLKKK